MKEQNPRPTNSVQPKEAQWASFFKIDPENWPDLPPPEIPWRDYFKPKRQRPKARKWRGPAIKSTITLSPIFPSHHFSYKIPLEQKSPIPKAKLVEGPKPDELKRRLLNLQASNLMAQIFIQGVIQYNDNLEKARKFFQEHPELNRDFSTELYLFSLRPRDWLIKSSIDLWEEIQKIKRETGHLFPDELREY
jgi:hypothetical protein